MVPWNARSHSMLTNTSDLDKGLNVREFITIIMNQVYKRNIQRDIYCITNRKMVFECSNNDGSLYIKWA